MSCVAQVPMERTIYLLLVTCYRCTCRFSHNSLFQLCTSNVFAFLPSLGRYDVIFIHMLKCYLLDDIICAFKASIIGLFYFTRIYIVV